MAALAGVCAEQSYESEAAQKLEAHAQGPWPTPDPALWRLNLGVFVLHAVQIAFFIVMPGWLVERAGVPLSGHGPLYLIAVAVSIALMVGPLGWGERRGQMRLVFASANSSSASGTDA